MKYFNPSYWFKLWVLSAPLFNDKTQGINAMSIDNNQKIKDWASKNTSDISLIENQELSLSNNETIQLQNNENIKSIKNLETDHFYENFLKTQGWSRDPQIAQHQLQEIQEEHHHFLKSQHAIYKRDFNAKKEIEFINNNFFYKLDINYDSGKVWGGSTFTTKFLYWPIIIIPNFKKYANSWEEFEKKFPEVEFNNLKVELGGAGNDVIKTWNTFKISTKLNKENIWGYYSNYYWNKSLSNSYPIECYFNAVLCSKFPHGVGTNFWERFNLHILAEYQSRGNVVFVPYQQDSVWMLRLFPDNDKLLVDTALYMHSNNAVYSTWGKLKYDSVRLVGEVDWNPLLALTIEQSKNIENWYKKEQKVISDSKNDPNFSHERIKNIEDAFNAEFVLWLTQLRTDFIQNLVLIDHDNKINGLNKEIEKIKERLTNLEQSKGCIQQIVDKLKTEPISSTSDKFIDSIADDKSIKEIFKATTKAFTTSLIKGPLNAVLGCLVDSVTHSLTRRNIIEENQFDNRSYENEITNVNKLLNTTQWDKNITNLINHEQNLPIINKTNFITNNITSL